MSGCGRRGSSVASPEQCRYGGCSRTRVAGRVLHFSSFPRRRESRDMRTRVVRRLDSRLRGNDGLCPVNGYYFLTSSGGSVGRVATVLADTLRFSRHCRAKRMMNQLTITKENGPGGSLRQSTAGHSSRPDLAIPCRTNLRSVPARQQSPTPFHQARISVS